MKLNTYLVSSAYQIQVVLVEEFRDDVTAEREGDSAIILTPACRVLVRIRPQQITQQTYP